MTDSTDAAMAQGHPTDPVPAATAEPALDPVELSDSLVAWWRAMPGVILKWALGIDALVLVLYGMGAVFFQRSPELYFLLNLEREGNPPSWWFGSQQLLVALVFLMLAAHVFASDERIRQFRALFLVSGLGFGFISLDEIGEIHEMISRFLVRYETVGSFLEDFEHNVFHVKHRIHGGGAWIVIYAVIGIVLLFWLVPQIVKAFKVWPKAVGMVAAGFGTFAFSAAVLQVFGYFTKVGTSAHYIYVVVEQGLKMAGISVALYGALLVLSAGAVRLTQTLAGTGAAE